MRAALLVVTALSAASCGPPAATAPRAATLVRPNACREIAAGTALRAAAAAATPGAALCLAPGRHAGPVRIGPGVTVWGAADAVVDRAEGGTVIELEAGATLLGVTVSGRGGVFDREDAAVRIAGDHARVEGVTVVDAVFGILAERVAYATIRGNLVNGSHDGAMGMRGDPIRLWEVNNSIVDDNVVDGGRDVVVWYSSDNRVERNRITGVRYGTHLMYSHHNRVAGNRYVGDVVGVFVMYSHDVDLDGNVISDAGGAAGMGVGLKDSGNIVVSGNAFVRDQTGLYLDETPLEKSHTLVVERNLFGRCDAAVIFHASSHHNTFRDNDFIANPSMVRVEGGGDATDVTWSGNYFDDYTGYDLDGDDRGDLPYELRSFEGELTERTPSVAFFRGTPALGMAEAITTLVPMYRPQIVLVDPSPRMAPRPWEGVDAD